MTDSTSDVYVDRILDAARALLVAHGLRRTSIADVVASSGVSRATLFRRFATRSDLIEALMAREIADFLADVAARVQSIDDPIERIAILFVRFVEVVPDHAVLRRLLESDPETVLPKLTTDAEALLSIGRGLLRAELDNALEAGYHLTASPEFCTDLVTRIAHSYMLLPPEFRKQEWNSLGDLVRDTVIRMILREP